MKLTMEILVEDFLVKIIVHRCLQSLARHGTRLIALLLSISVSYLPLTLRLQEG